MPYALSILDKSPVSAGETASDALRRTIELAQLAERLGYRRFWVAEHHNEPELASAALETLIAYLLARTSRIEQRQPCVIAGTPEQVHVELGRLHNLYGAEEFIIDPVAEGQRRFDVLELLARKRSAAAA